MHHANVPSDIKHLLMPEAVKTATKLDNLILVTVGSMLQSRYKHFEGKVPDWVFHMKTFGEAGVVKIKARKMHPKEADRGVTCFFAGYPDDHPGDCYRMWDPKTGRIHTTRDIIWLHCMYFPKPKNGKEIALGDLLMLEPVEIIEDTGAGEGTRTQNEPEEEEQNEIPEVSEDADNTTMEDEEVQQDDQEPRRLMQPTETCSGRTIRAPSDWRKQWTQRRKVMNIEYDGCRRTLL